MKQMAVLGDSHEKPTVVVFQPLWTGKNASQTITVASSLRIR